MKTISSILVTVGAAALVLFAPLARAQEGMGQPLFKGPLTIAAVSTNTTVQLPIVPKGYAVGTGGVGSKPFTIWLTFSNSAAGVSSNVWTCTYFRDATTLDFATTNLLSAAYSFTFTNVANGTNLTRQMWQYPGTNFNGIGGFAVTAVANTNATITTTFIDGTVKFGP